MAANGLRSRDFASFMKFQLKSGKGVVCLKDKSIIRADWEKVGILSRIVDDEG